MMSSLVLVDETRPNPDEALSGVIFAPTLDAHPSCNAQEHDIVRFRRMRIQTHPRKSDVQVSIFRLRFVRLCVCAFVCLCVCVCCVCVWKRLLGWGHSLFETPWPPILVSLFPRSGAGRGRAGAVTSARRLCPMERARR